MGKGYKCINEYIFGHADIRKYILRIHSVKIIIVDPCSETFKNEV